MHASVTNRSAVITIAGDLDLSSVDAANSVIDRTLADHDDLARLELDLSDVAWLDSVGLGLLVALRTKSLDRSLELILRGLSAKVLRILTLSGLVDLFTVVESGVEHRLVEGQSPSARFPLPEELPLPPVADRKFDQIAELTRRAIDAPRAFVTLVDTSRQAFPGAAGVPADAEREQPLDYSLCQYVVTSGEPLVVDDARNDPAEVVRTNSAVVEGMLSAYAGMPLTDLNGTVVGTLCVAADEPREWTPAQLATLADLAEVASSELQLRTAMSNAAVAADRERIVSDLNDRVFNELLSLSMLLSSAQSITSGRAGQMLDEASMKVDEVLRGLRAAIFDRAG